MLRKILISAALACALLAASGCGHHKVQNPLANVDSKQPDKGLFDRAMESMRKGHFQEARTLLETLINTYPDSEYIARAKLAIGDAWYTEGGTAASQQAEMEYKDFQTFFPNLPEASEAQLKVANIHYRQMEKPDRDFAQAARAAEEYKLLISQYPESPLVPQAKQRLREVQEVLAERQFRIAHFYFLRVNLAASQARLQSLIDSYPLYSGVDEALYELGLAYEREAATMRKQDKLDAAKREKMTAGFEQHAIDAYSKIITRYPAMSRAEDARKRLAAMKAPIPQAAPEAIAANKAEQQSRSDDRFSQRMLGNFKKHPSVARASKVGEPNMSEEKIASAPAMVQAVNNEILGITPQATPQAGQKIGIDAVTGGTGTPGANEPPPGNAPPKAAPAQVNELQKTPPTDAKAQDAAQPGSAQSGDAKSADDKQDSTSKKKKKKGLRKLVPF
ncbi:MAG: outer membrane protein assembly factor BamD [Acidobacteriia bacterium]|nr:outer membrane protein assembly factor BamD [Terriglobia bacterium]